HMAARIGVAVRILFCSPISHLRLSLVGGCKRSNGPAHSRRGTRDTSRPTQALVPHYVDWIWNQCLYGSFTHPRVSHEGPYQPGLLHEIGAHSLGHLDRHTAERSRFR